VLFSLTEKMTEKKGKTIMKSQLIILTVLSLAVSVQAGQPSTSTANPTQKYTSTVVNKIKKHAEKTARQWLNKKGANKNSKIEKIFLTKSSVETDMTLLDVDDNDRTEEVEFAAEVHYYIDPTNIEKGENGEYYAGYSCTIQYSVKLKNKGKVFFTKLFSLPVKDLDIKIATVKTDSGETVKNMHCGALAN